VDNFVFLSNNNRLCDCPKWWQNFVEQINPHGEPMVVRDYLKNIGARIENNGIKFEEKDSMVSFLLMWAS
jgi:hypothetical protein